MIRPVLKSEYPTAWDYVRRELEQRNVRFTIPDQDVLVIRPDGTRETVHITDGI